MISYYTTTCIWLSLEPYYNKGITPERAKELIEQIDDPFNNRSLRCIGQFVNGNWIVETEHSNRTWQYDYLVNLIESALDNELEKL